MVRIPIRPASGRPLGLMVAALIAAGLGGCGSFDARFGGAGTHLVSATDERECLMRAMYFESNRSSEEGMLAVGTVVMNRVQDAKYPKSICGVVGQPNQFAPGVMTNPMTSRATTRVASVADRVIAGERNEQVGSALHFHTAGYTYPYHNMHYVAVAGGNAFYEKKTNPTQSQIMVASLADREEQALLPASLRGRAMQMASRRVEPSEPAIVTASLSTPREEEEAPARVAPARSYAPIPVVAVPKPSFVVASLSVVRHEPSRFAAKPDTRPDAKAQPVALARIEPRSRFEPKQPAKIVLAAATPQRPATTRTGNAKAESTKTGSSPAASALPPARSSRTVVALLAKYEAPPEPPKRVKLSSLRHTIGTE